MHAQFDHRRQVDVREMGFQRGGALYCKHQEPKKFPPKDKGSQLQENYINPRTLRKSQIKK